MISFLVGLFLTSSAMASGFESPSLHLYDPKALLSEEKKTLFLQITEEHQGLTGEVIQVAIFPEDVSLEKKVQEIFPLWAPPVPDENATRILIGIQPDDNDSYFFTNQAFDAVVSKELQEKIRKDVLNPFLRKKDLVNAIIQTTTRILTELESPLVLTGEIQQDLQSQDLELQITKENKRSLFSLTFYLFFGFGFFLFTVLLLTSPDYHYASSGMHRLTYAPIWEFFIRGKGKLNLKSDTTEVFHGHWS